MTKLDILKEHQEWLEWQLKEVLKDTEWFIPTNIKSGYRINPNTPNSEIPLMMANGYSLVLEIKKELVKTKLEIIDIEERDND